MNVTRISGADARSAGKTVAETVDLVGVDRTHAGGLVGTDLEVGVAVDEGERLTSLMPDRLTAARIARPTWVLAMEEDGFARLQAGQ